MRKRDDEGICQNCGVRILMWPPPHWMHDPGMDPKTGTTQLYRYCKTTVAEPQETA